MSDGRMPQPGHVHLWPISLDVANESLERLVETLSDDERSRAAAFRHTLHRSRYVAGRAQLRRILGQYLDQHPSEVRFSYGARGKPELGNNYQHMHFNISRSNQRALCAITRGAAIGADIESAAAIANLKSLAKNIMSPLEHLLFEEIPLESRLNAFYYCWTRKEAYLKAKGIGVATSLQQVSVSLADEADPKLLQCEAEQELPSDWTLRSWRLPGGFVAAVALHGKIHSCTWQQPWSAEPASISDQPLHLFNH